MKESIHELPSLEAARKRTFNGCETIRDGVLIPLRLKEYAKGKKYFIRTYGCQANVIDSSNIAGILENIGFEKCDDPLSSDIVILNTCAVRENAEDKVFGEVGSLKRLKSSNKKAIIALCGCMVQQPHVIEILRKKYQQTDLVFGTHNINRLPSLIDEVVFSKKRVIEVLSKEGEVIENLPIVREDNFKAFVNIMYGCDKFCTYCIVPYTRGKQRSRNKEDILNEVRQLKKLNYQEVTLIGQNVNAYGKDLKNENITFAELLEEVAKIGIPRVRFTTSHPWDFTEEMFKVMQKYENIMPYIHLPLQSGSDNILKKMGRRYTGKSYMDLVDKLREIIPGVALSTDIIVGFPNETEEDFLKTLEVVRHCKYDSAFTFIYSPRIGTPAAKMEDLVTREEKGERFNRLVKVLEKSITEKANAYIGKTVKVLVDGYSKKDDQLLSGYTETNKLVNFKGNEEYIGKIVKVKILESHTYSLIGEMVDE